MRPPHLARLAHDVVPGHLAVPEVGAISVVSIRSVVDLPAPLGPRKATSSPRADLEVEVGDRLARSSCDGEVAGEALGRDHRPDCCCSVMTGTLGICGQFLTAIGASLTGMNTSARMLRLLSLLQTHRYWPGGELADRLEVSPRTLRRDVDRLRELGYVVDAARGVAGGYQLRAGGSLPPLLLEDEEAVAIAVGLQHGGRRRGRRPGGDRRSRR